MHSILFLKGTNTQHLEKAFAHLPGAVFSSSEFTLSISQQSKDPSLSAHWPKSDFKCKATPKIAQCAPHLARSMGILKGDALMYMTLTLYMVEFQLSKQLKVFKAHISCWEKFLVLFCFLNQQMSLSWKSPVCFQLIVTSLSLFLNLPTPLLLDLESPVLLNTLFTKIVMTVDGSADITQCEYKLDSQVKYPCVYVGHS